MLLHKSSTPQSSSVQKLQNTESEKLLGARALVRRVLGESLVKLQEEHPKNTRSIRWELGACWVQHLQNQGKNDTKKTEEAKIEPAVKGLGKQGGLLKEIKKKIDGRTGKTDQGNSPSSDEKLNAVDQKEIDKQDEVKEEMWKTLLPEGAYLRLKESETGLHRKVGLLHLK